MNSVEQALNEFVRRRRGAGLIVATVLAVHRDSFLFDCEDADGSPYLDVRINATTGKSGLLVVPAVNSTVIITDLGNQGSDWVLASAGTISDVYLVVNDQVTAHLSDRTLQLGGGARVENAVLGQGLNTLLTTLLAHLQSLTTGLTAFATANQTASAGALAPLAPAYAALLATLNQVAPQLAQLTGQLPDHLSTTVTLTK